jgi:hypothetical protein
MRRATGVLAVPGFVLVGFVAAVAAQDVHPPASDPPPSFIEASVTALSPDQDRELTSWLKAMEQWQRYDAKWYNRPARDRLGRVTARRPQPVPPEWLAAHCAEAAASGVLNLDARTTRACQLFADPRAPLGPAATHVQAARASAEQKPKHTSFLTRVHLDGLWSTTSTTGRFYGLIGSHVSLVDVGRLQVFGPPGVLLLSVPDADGSRRITLGYTWGLSVRLTDVRLFGSKDMTLFVNLSKVWIASGGDSTGTSRGYDIVGFSVAPRKNR